MERLYLEEKSLEWFEFRSVHRTASEAPTVMCVNPYMTARELWEQKSGGVNTFTGNVATEFGVEKEPVARAIAEKDLGIKLENAVFKDGEYSASLDAYGEDGARTVKVEIKCVYAGEKSKRWQAALKGEILENDKWQMTHQDMICPTDESYLMIFVNENTYDLIKFLPNQGDDIILKAAWDDFYENPPEPKYAIRDDLLSLAEEYKLKKAELNAATKAFESVEKDLKASCKEDSIIGNVQIQNMTRVGAVDYKAIPEFDDINLDDYRKKSISYKKVSVK